MANPPPNPPEPPRQPDGLERVCAGILRTEFGRRKSDAVNKAMVQLAVEENLSAQPEGNSSGSWRKKIREWLNAASSRPIVAFAAALILIFAAALSALLLRPTWFGGSHPSAPLCYVTDASGAQWAANSPQLKIGSAVPTGTLCLESGVIELTFTSTAKVAVQGPAQFSVAGAKLMNLQSGKIATDVPKKARGFTVVLPTARAIDMGTRFGAIVGSDNTSEVDVFEGRVRLIAATAQNPQADWHLTQGQAVMMDSHSAESASALPEAAFPQPTVTRDVRPQNCGFDVSGRAALGGIPVNFGYWCGPAYSLVIGASQGVRPFSGNGMLQFSPWPRKDNYSEVWQLINLRPYKNLLAGGDEKATLSAYFCRVPKPEFDGDKFGLAFAAFHGRAADARSLWLARKTEALAMADNETDGTKAGWQKLEATATLPPDADFVIIELRAIASGLNSRPTVFAGHFADLVHFDLTTPMRASSLAVSR
jgi:FecR protein